MRRLALLAATPLALAAPAARAQPVHAVTPFAALNASVAGTPAVYGASLATFSGALGVRAGAGAGSRAGRGGPGTYVADIDAVLSPGRIPVAGAILGGFLPTVFAGIGREGARDAGGAWKHAGVLSYGAGVSRALLPGVTLEGETRQRRPVTASGGAPAAVFSRGWEYRAGITIHFGGGPRTSASRAPAGASLPLPLPGGGSRGGAPAARRAVDAADDHLGVPYLYGGTTPRGFDCSGLVQYVYRGQAVTLPRTSRQQAQVGRALSTSPAAMLPGDLIFFATDGARIDHVAMYAGGNRIIHSSSSGGGVRYDDLGTERGRWFVRHIVAARRVSEDGRSLVGALGAALRLAGPLDPPDRAPRR